MFWPLRKTRQRKPSHFGSYCQPAPVGIASTDDASIGASGGLTAGKLIEVIITRGETAVLRIFEVELNRIAISFSDSIAPRKFEV
jgi:hypothetical protein